MARSIAVNPDGLAAIGRQLAVLAEQVRGAGEALTVVGRPLLGGTNPSRELSDGLSTGAAMSASRVLACGAALRSLAAAATTAAETYRGTEVQAAQRLAAMAETFEDFGEGPETMTAP